MIWRERERERERIVGAFSFSLILYHTLLKTAASVSQVLHFQFVKDTILPILCSLIR